jgi:hypothetical protein
MRSAADIGEILRGQNIKIDVLGVNVWLGGIFKIFTIRRIIKSFRPDIIHTWLYRANVVGGLAGVSWSDARIVWGALGLAFAQPHQMVDPFDAKDLVSPVTTLG